MPAPLPDDEEFRLDALRQFAFLDTEPTELFDDVTRIAAYICDAPIAMVSFVQEDRQWFLSRHGTELRETDLCLSFCSYAILGEEVFEVPDALDDVRFVENSLVAGDPHIRFYAGAPLKSPDGYNLGTLCVIDYQPRTLSSEQRTVLKALTRQVGALLEGAIVRRRLAGALSSLEAFDRTLSACTLCGDLIFDDRQLSLREYVGTHSAADFHDSVCRTCTPKYQVEPNVPAGQFRP